MAQDVLGSVVETIFLFNKAGKLPKKIAMTVDQPPGFVLYLFALTLLDANSGEAVKPANSCSASVPGDKLTCKVLKLDPGNGGAPVWIALAVSSFADSIFDGLRSSEASATTVTGTLKGPKKGKSGDIAVAFAAALDASNATIREGGLEKAKQRFVARVLDRTRQLRAELER